MSRDRTGEWVEFVDRHGHWRRGRITQAAGKAIRIVSDGRQFRTGTSGKGEKVNYAKVKAVNFGVFVFDTVLSSGFRVDREGQVFWREYCRAAQWTVAAERIHSLADLRYFLGKRRIKEHVLLFNGHGTAEGWCMSNGDVLGADSNITIDRRNHGRVVVISSCHIGQNAELCRALRSKLHANALIAYTRSVGEDFCYLLETALFQQLANAVEPKVAVSRVCKAFQGWQVLNQSHTKKVPLVCY